MESIEQAESDDGRTDDRTSRNGLPVSIASQQVTASNLAKLNHSKNLDITTTNQCRHLKRGRKQQNEGKSENSGTPKMATTTQTPIVRVIENQKQSSYLV